MKKRILLLILWKNINEIKFWSLWSSCDIKTINQFKLWKSFTKYIKFYCRKFFDFTNNSNDLCIIEKIIIIENKYKEERFNKIKLILIKKALELIQNPYGN